MLLAALAAKMKPQGCGGDQKTRPRQRAKRLVDSKLSVLRQIERRLLANSQVIFSLSLRDGSQKLSSTCDRSRLLLKPVLLRLVLALWLSDSARA